MKLRTQSRQTFLCYLILLFITCLPALASQSGHDPASKSQSPNSADSKPMASNESPREAELHEEDKFKQSASVKLLARITGLSSENAYWLGMIVNFLIVAGLIGWFAAKSLPAAFRNRNASIRKAMEEARKASEDAKHRLADIESKLSRLDSEIASLRETADRQSAEEEERIRATTEEEARKIAEVAQMEIAAALKTARRDLTAYAADLAVGLAAKQLHVDAATDQVLIRNFAQQLPASSGNPRTSEKGSH
ncbi:MAG TPA: ATP synthase F0 subunit B [Terriglobales bacterium]|jgi:F-type H+-transporting ATPase subunit b